MNRFISIIATLSLVAGCTGAEPAADDSELAGFTEEAQTWGGPGIGLPPSVTKDANDIVEIYGPETVACSEMGATKAALKAECAEDGGLQYSVMYRYHSEAEDCTVSVAIGCLFKIAND